MPERPHNLPIRKTLANIAAASVKRRNFPLLVEKVVERFKERGHNAQKEAVKAWCMERAEPWPAFATALNPGLWTETETVCEAIGRAAQAKIDRLGLDLGGPGHYPLLYFLTRHVRPRAVLETGVAAGWSSQAILTALRENAAGHLYSSDFPYFRLKDPEQYVGYVVDESLKDRWTLLIDGDRNNLPEIAGKVESLDLFHYDSDKTYAGREFGWNSVKDKLSSQAFVLFDDIQDNFHFRDLAMSLGRPFRVFTFDGKYVGLITMG